MNDETKPATTPEISQPALFIRGLIERISKAISDPTASLAGPSRLVANILRQQGRQVLGSVENYQTVQEWQKRWDELQAVVLQHDVHEAQRLFEAQLERIHSDPKRDIVAILSKPEIEHRFHLIADSVYHEQHRLYRENIPLARAFAREAAEILKKRAEVADANERAHYEWHGLPYSGSPIVSAINNARQYVLSRVSQDESRAGPSLVLPWLIL